MICPYCNYPKTFVVDCRITSDGEYRSRQCVRCNKRFGTMEQVTSKPGKVFPDRLKPTKRPVNYYTVYNSKTDEVIAAGSARDCARQMDMSETSFYHAVMKFKRGTGNKYYIVIDDYNESEMI